MINKRTAQCIYFKLGQYVSCQPIFLHIFYVLEGALQLKLLRISMLLTDFLKRYSVNYLTDCFYPCAFYLNVCLYFQGSEVKYLTLRSLEEVLALFTNEETEEQDREQEVVEEMGDDEEDMEEVFGKEAGSEIQRINSVKRVAKGDFLWYK